MGCLKLTSSIGLLSDKTPMAKKWQKLINMLLFIRLTRKSMAAEEVPLSAVSEAITMLDRARYLIALSTPSLLKAFCRPLHQWPCLEVRDKDAAQPKDMRQVCTGRGSLRVWDDIMVCVSGPWEKSHFPFLGHVTYGICISGSGSPNLSQVTAGIRGLQTAWKK